MVASLYYHYSTLTFYFQSNVASVSNELTDFLFKQINLPATITIKKTQENTAQNGGGGHSSRFDYQHLFFFL